MNKFTRTLLIIIAILGMTKLAHANNDDAIALELRVKPGDKFHTTKTITENKTTSITEIDWEVLNSQESDKIVIQFSENGQNQKTIKFEKNGNWGKSSDWGYNPVGPLLMQFNNVEYDNNFVAKPTSTKVGSKWTWTGGNTEYAIVLNWKVTSRNKGIMSLDTNLND